MGPALCMTRQGAHPDGKGIPFFYSESEIGAESTVHGEAGSASEGKGTPFFIPSQRVCLPLALCNTKCCLSNLHPWVQAAVHLAIDNTHQLSRRCLSQGRRCRRLGKWQRAPLKSQHYKRPCTRHQGGQGWGMQRRRWQGWRGCQNRLQRQSAWQADSQVARRHLCIFTNTRSSMHCLSQFAGRLTGGVCC
jgi:hypothetical protein